MNVTLTIRNVYGDETVVTAVAASVPAPQGDDLNEWATVHLHPLTGTDRPLTAEGRTADSAYYATVTDCPEMPWLVGRTFEWSD